MADEVKDAGNQGEEEVSEETKVESSKEETQVEKTEEAEQEAGGEVDFNAFEPEVRKTPSDYIKERKERRAQTEGQEEEEVGEVSPEVRKVLERIAEEKAREALTPFEKVLHESADEREITDFISRPGNEDFRKYAPVVKKMMQAYKGITAENAFLLADAKFGNPVERGAEQARERLAKSSKAKGGSSFRKSAPSDEELADQIRGMTDEQFAEFNARLNTKKK